MITYPSMAQAIEQLYSQRGLATRVILNNPVGESEHQLIFPFGREQEAHQHLVDANRLLTELLNLAEARLTPRTVLFHFAYELFAGVRLPRQVFRSVNVRNLHDPHVETRAFKATKLAPSAHLRPSWRAAVLHYYLDVILISANRGDAASVVDGLQQAVNVFNGDSEFIKVGKLRWGWSESRVVTAFPSLRSIPIVIDL